MHWKSTQTKIYFFQYYTLPMMRTRNPCRLRTLVPRNFFLQSINGIVTGNWFGSEKERHSAIGFLDQNLAGHVRLSIRLRSIIFNAANALFSIGLIPKQRISVSKLRFQIPVSKFIVVASRRSFILVYSLIFKLNLKP